MLKRMQLIAGHPLLVPAAQEALRQWKFRTPEEDGRPVEGSTVVDVNFALPPAEAQPSQTAAGQTRPAPATTAAPVSLIRVDGNVQMANLIKKVGPRLSGAGASGGRPGRRAVLSHHWRGRPSQKHSARIRSSPSCAGRTGSGEPMAVEAYAVERAGRRSHHYRYGSVHAAGGSMIWVIMKKCRPTCSQIQRFWPGMRP